MWPADNLQCIFTTLQPPTLFPNTLRAEIPEHDQSLSSTEFHLPLFGRQAPWSTPTCSQARIYTLAANLGDFHSVPSILPSRRCFFVAVKYQKGQMFMKTECSMKCLNVSTLISLSLNSSQTTPGLSKQTLRYFLLKEKIYKLN